MELIPLVSLTTVLNAILVSIEARADSLQVIAIASDYVSALMDSAMDI